MGFTFSVLIAVWIVHEMRKSLETAERIPEWDRVLSNVWAASVVLWVVHWGFDSEFVARWYWKLIYLVIFWTVYLLREYRPAWLYAVALLPLAVSTAVCYLFYWVTPGFFHNNEGWFSTAQSFSVAWLIGFSIYASIQNTKERKARKAAEEERKHIEARKEELEHLVEARTVELTNQKQALEKALEELKATQAQLIQSEKLASLGELTAGIAHEIQNPLNFVNNFSELSVDLAKELQTEIDRIGTISDADKTYIGEILSDLVQNQTKINHHGKRAASIVTGMLQHARTGTGKKEATDINHLAEEFLRLSYHGLRAKDNTFNAKMEISLDPAVGILELVPQDMGRVLLNLMNNAFYAVSQRKKQGETGYQPTLWLSTKKLPTGGVEVKVRDNGTGIPDHLKEKIFRPFFTTKPTGEGTGLGLSLAYDIITKGHGGSLEVDSTEGQGTTFTIRIP